VYKYMLSLFVQVPARMAQLDPADLLTDSAEDADKPAIAIQVCVCVYEVYDALTWSLGVCRNRNHMML